jgi:ABC-type phosphate transport system substrate-binding protein
MPRTNATLDSRPGIVLPTSGTSCSAVRVNTAWARSTERVQGRRRAHLENASAIGYSGLAFAVPGVRPLTIVAERDGAAVAPSESTVLDGSYPLARALYLYALLDRDPAADGFLRWALSPADSTS